MAEIAAAVAASALFAGEAGAVTAGAAATTAAAGAATAAGGLSLSTGIGLLAAGSGIFATLAGLSSSQTKAEGLRAQASESEAEARQEQNQTLDRQRRIRAAALKATGESDVSFAASGLDLGYGEAAQSRADILDKEQGELTIDREGANATSAQFLRRAAIYRRMAGQTQNAGYLSAAASALDAGYKIGRRG